MRFCSLLVLVVIFFSMTALFAEERKLEGHERELYSVAYSADGKWIVSAANDQTIRVWSLADGSSVVLKTGYGASRTGSISPDGSTVVGRFENGVGVWNAKTGERTATLKGDPSNDGTVQRVLFSPDGKTIAVGHERGTVRIWDVASSKPTSEFKRTKPNSDSYRVLSIAFLPDAQLAVGYDNALVIWSITNQSELQELSNVSTQSIYYVENAKLLVANQQGNVGFLRIWNATNWKVVFTSDQKDFSENFLKDLNPMDSTLAIGVNDQGEFESFDLSKFKRTSKTFSTPYRTPPAGFAINPTSMQVAHFAGGNQYQIHLQNVNLK